MAQTADTACPSCGGQVKLIFTILAFMRDKDGNESDTMLMTVGRCTKLCWQRGDKRTVRIFVTIDRKIALAANTNTLPILVFQTEEKQNG